MLSFHLFILLPFSWNLFGLRRQTGQNSPYRPNTFTCRQSHDQHTSPSLAPVVVFSRCFLSLFIIVDVETEAKVWDRSFWFSAGAGQVRQRRQEGGEPPSNSSSSSNSRYVCLRVCLRAGRGDEYGAVTKTPVKRATRRTTHQLIFSARQNWKQVGNRKSLICDCVVF